MMVSERAGQGGEPAPAADVATSPDAAAALSEAAVQRLRHRAVLAHRELRILLALRAVLAILGAIVAVVAALGLADAGIVNHRFPAFLPGDDSTVITSYSGPLLASAIGVGAVAGLLLVSAVTDLWRRALMGPDLAGSRAGLGH